MVIIVAVFASKLSLGLDDWKVAGGVLSWFGGGFEQRWCVCVRERGRERESERENF